MKIVLARYGGTFFIGQESENHNETEMIQPAQVVYMPVQSSIQGSSGIGFATNIVFLGVKAFDVPAPHVILADTDPLARHYHATLMIYERQVKESLTIN